VQKKAQEIDKDDGMRFGAVQGLNKKLDQNELAARGLKMSLMEKLRLEKKAPKTVDIEI